MQASIAIIAPNRAAWSETFIKAQRERLPARVHYLYGAWLPRHRPDDRHFVSDSPVWRGALYFADRMLGRPLHHTLRKRILAYLREHKIEAVLAQYGPSGVEMLPLCRAAGIPLIVHFHGFDAYDADLLAGYGDRYPELFKGAEAIIAVSREMMQELEKMGAPAEKLHYNPCGADVDLFRVTRPGKNPPHFLAAGRLVSTKAPHVTLEAFALVSRVIPEARLIMAGDGPLSETCATLVERLGLSQKVEMPGVLAHEEVALFMEKARAFVQHSVTSSTGDSEGTPVAIMEAGAAGLPVVSTLHAGIPDVVIPEKTGFLVQENDIKGMAAAMIHLARFPETADRMGAEARQRVEAEFNLEKRLDRLWSIIEAAIKGGKS